MNDATGRLKGLIRSYLIFGLVGLLCVIYAVLGTLDIQKNEEARLVIIIGDMMVPYIFGIAITAMLKEQGLLIGGDEPSVIAAVAEHERIAALCAPFVQQLSAWCREQTDKALRLERMRILADEGLSYEIHFPDGGMPAAYEPRFKPLRFGRTGWLSRAKWNRLEAKRERAFYKAAALRIRPLAAGELISEGHRKGDPFYLGRSQAEYRAQTFGTSLITKPVIALCVGYLTVRRIENFDPMTIIWQLFGVVLFLAFGVMAMLKAIDYKRNEYAGRLKKETGFLTQFLNEKGDQNNGETDDGSAGKREGGLPRVHEEAGGAAEAGGRVGSADAA